MVSAASSPSARLLALALTAATLGLAACGASDDGSAPPETENVAAEVTTSSVSPSAPATVISLPGSDADGSAGGDTQTAVDAALNGQAFEGHVSSGDLLAVAGVAHDDVLNVRAGPGTDQVVVATLEPLADDVRATGRARRLPNSIWYEVATSSGVVGWAGSAFLTFVGNSDDATGELVEIAGESDKAALTGSLDDLAGLVESAYASENTEGALRVSRATPGDNGTVVLDIVGFADDSISGYRLKLTTIPSTDGTTRTVDSLERTTLCGRGVANGRCI